MRFFPLIILILPLMLFAEVTNMSSVGDNGGGEISSSGYTNSASIGQAVQGDASSSTYSEHSGFIRDEENTSLDLDEEIPVAENAGNITSSVYPNPFRSTTTIEFYVKSSTEITLEIFNIKGKRVISRPLGSLSMGLHSVDIEANDIPEGVYLYKIGNSSNYDMKKMLIIR